MEETHHLLLARAVFGRFALILFIAVAASAYAPPSRARALRVVSGSLPSAFPRFSKASFATLGSSILVNALLTGTSATASPIYRATGEAKPHTPALAVEGLGGKWLRITIPEEIRDSLRGIVVTGGIGTLRVEVVDGVVAGGGEGPFFPIDELVIEQGRLRSTLIANAEVLTNPLGMGIEIFDNDRGKFIGGEIVALSGREVAFEFEGLPHPVISEGGGVRLSIKTPEGNYLNSTVSAWGYYLEVQDTDIDSSSDIGARVFGLPGDELVRFTFTPLAGQTITPRDTTLSVGEINSGKPIAEVKTTLPGAQPLSVVVKRVGPR